MNLIESGGLKESYNVLPKIFKKSVYFKNSSH